MCKKKVVSNRRTLDTASNNDMLSLVELNKLIQKSSGNNIFITIAGGDIMMESEKMGISMSQNIANNSGTANMAAGSIVSTNYTTQGSKEDINTVLENLRNLINSGDFSQEDKESVVDDIDTIQEQINNTSGDSGKVKTKLKKALAGIKVFISNMPSNIATAIVTQANDLYEKIKPIIGQ